MAFTAEILVELANAIREQMERCPGCFGVGRIRQSGDYQACFCLVCEEVAKSMYLIDRSWYVGYIPKLDNQKIYDQYKEQFDRTIREAGEFAKRCPGCYGITRVWAGNKPRKCFVCERLLVAIATYVAATDPAQPTPNFMPASTGRLLINRDGLED